MEPSGPAKADDASNKQMMMTAAANLKAVIGQSFLADLSFPVIPRRSAGDRFKDTQVLGTSSHALRSPAWDGRPQRRSADHVPARACSALGRGAAEPSATPANRSLGAQGGERAKTLPRPPLRALSTLLRANPL